MVIGVVSDVHCNEATLRRAFEAMVEQQVDEILVAGDLMLEYRFSNAIVELIQEFGARAVLGNHDLTLLGRDGERARSAAAVNPAAVAWLADQPLQLRASCDGSRLLMLHGSPWEPYYEYLFPASPRLAAADELDADIVVLGHTHVPFVRAVGDCLVVNPGTTGMPRGAGARCTFAIIDTAAKDAEIRAVDDLPAQDRDATAR
jgi:putative phosphoesterase